MNKEKTLYGIIGLLVGLIVGYLGTNYINRGAAPAPNAMSSAASLPPNHPPAGSQPSSDASSGMQGEVTAVIEQARKEPTNFDAQMQAAGMYSQINRPEGALEFYSRAAKIKPNDFELLAKLGDTNFDLQRYEEAEQWYQQALRIKPNDATVRMDLGLSYYLRTPRELDKAIAAYRDALRADARHEKTLQNLTQALLEKGDKAAAQTTLQQLAQVNPSNPALAQFRAQLSQ
jgi:tetratricopeptide (TPR) repeat protein